MRRHQRTDSTTKDDPRRVHAVLALFIALPVLMLWFTRDTAAAPQFPNRVIGKAGRSPINATEVIQPIYKDLVRVAGSTNREAFMKQANQLLTVRVYTVTYSRLVAHTMLEKMPVTDRTAFENTIELHKQKLIKEFGNGDADVADQQLRKERGITLEQLVINAKTTMLVQQFQKALKSSVPPVTDAQAIEFYKANGDKFNVEDQRRIRLIQIDPKDKAAMTAALKAGTPFADVAKSKTNLFRADRGGDMGDVPGKTIFANKTVNEATLALKQGETSPPIDVDGKVWWVHVEKLSLGQAEPTAEQRDAIRKELETQQFALLERHYRARLFKTVEHTKIEDMVIALQPYLVAIFDNANDR